MGFGVGSISVSSITVSSISVDGIGIPVQIPSGAEVFYEFSQSSETQAILELVNRQNSLNTDRASNVNAEQLNDTVKTFLPGFAALISGQGGGLLVQGEGENVVTDSLSLQSSSWAKRGSATATTSSVVSPDPAFFMDQATVTNDATADIFYTTNVAQNNVDSATSFWVGNSAGGNDDLRVSNAVGGPGFWVIDMSQISSPERMTRNHPAVTVSSDFMTDGIGGIGLLFRANAAVFVTFEFWQADQIPGQFDVSSPIYTNGAPDTRIADDSQIVTDNFPDTDFELTLPFEFRGSNAVDGRVAVSGTVFDLHYDDANGRYELITALGTVVSNAITPAFGDDIDLIVEVDAANGATLTINGSTGPANAAVTGVVWAAPMRYMNNLAGTSATNAVIPTTLIKPLT